MNGMIKVAMLHDATCEKGDEWWFHNMSGLKETDDGEKEEEKEEDDKPITEAELEDANIGCVVFCIMFLVGLGFGIYYLVTH